MTLSMAGTSRVLEPTEMASMAGMASHLAPRVVWAREWVHPITEASKRCKLVNKEKTQFMLGGAQGTMGRLEVLAMVLG